MQAGFNFSAPSPQENQLVRVGSVCAAKVLIGISAIFAMMAIVAMAIDQRDILLGFVLTAWSGVSYALSLGGHFWGAIAVCCSGLAIATWADCLGNHLPNLTRIKAVLLDRLCMPQAVQSTDGGVHPIA